MNIAVRTPGTAEMDWSVFMSAPVTYIHPQRFSACFGETIGAKGCERMIATPRLAKRLSDLITNAYNLGPAEAPASEEDLLIALMPGERLEQLARRAGAIFWGNTLGNVVLSQDVAGFSKSLGDDQWMLALHNRDLAGPAQPFDSVEKACASLADDGWKCLSAWCSSQTPGVGRRVRLKLAPHEHLDATSEEPIASLGPAIIRRAAAV
ncbi:type III secretion protein [Agaricicola taiwanensis]|uniref:Type III secretion protein n=1 Tax=Agaricicola taiwanensis TaxID=591372 RepID=A0A8J2YC81_9RHOB|nr:SctK family type III secretion system sorting platform protein [Agaricicola taiwanensis]GGE35976.1 type III secretion protein [Agaricicola taiwanensis]